MTDIKSIPDLVVTKERFQQMVYSLQDKITAKMQALDSSIQLTEDIWERSDFVGAPGGGGITRAFSGELFENAGVNTSLVYGKIDPQFAQQIGATGANSDEMWATGISLIIHPRNPRIPTTHANFRMIQAGENFWFGGGADLTPYYPHLEDFRHFHQVWSDACRPYDSYSKMKKTCDEYFVNKHRGGEMRGIGGIFFDHYSTGDLDADFQMVSSLAAEFCDSYFPIVEKRLNEEFTAQDEDFMLHRRGRYVEFNLLHDRGTHFGLKTNGRTDSILISLPARCKFTYRFTPASESPQAEMMKYYFPCEWAT